MQTVSVRVTNRIPHKAARLGFLAPYALAENVRWVQAMESSNIGQLVLNSRDPNRYG